MRRQAGMLAKVTAMFNEGYQKLGADDDLWPGLAERLRITDPKAVEAYRSKARLINNPPYRADLLPATQTLLSQIVALAGEEATGVSRLDPAAFLFP